MLYNIFLEKYILPLGDKIVGTSFIKELERLREYDKLSEDEINRLQKKKLSIILDHAIKHSEYYEQFKERSSDDPVKFLKNFPILTKKYYGKIVINF